MKYKIFFDTVHYKLIDKIEAVSPTPCGNFANFEALVHGKQTDYPVKLTILPILKRPREGHISII